MTDVITSGAAVITPSIILGYESSREQGTVVHPIINAASPNATLRVAGLRTGHMELGFSGPTAEADSRAAENTLAGAAVFTLASADLSSVVMSFVLPKGGRIVRGLEDSTRAAWVVGFDWQEVTP